MNTSENIHNALQVLYMTYENIQKLIESTIVIACEQTDYRLSVPKPLRWKSDRYSKGWLLNDFILLFQNSKDKDCKSNNGWKDGPIYVMEIYLGEKNVDKKPVIYLSKFEYNDMNAWNEGCSPANHWAFYNPLNEGKSIKWNRIENYRRGVTIDEVYSGKYWGLKQVLVYNIDLFSVDSSNLKEMIFDKFDLLREVSTNV